MKKLNREKVIRMVGGEINNRIGISSSGGSGGGGLAGAATQAWVDANYVSIEFFDRLFQAYSGTGSSATRVNANDTESTIDNIKAMFGFWTEQYISTLGQGSGGGGGGGAEALSDLLDVELTTLQNGQALIYSSALGKWTNGTAGVNMTQVWSALDSATNEQINVSHLTNALSGYVTTSAISDMATQTWVGQQGFATQTWVTSNFITIAFFDRLFQAYNGTGSSATRVNPNDTTSTIDNIKAMFGFWTEFYLSALGDGSASSGSISLGMLSDVTLSSPTDGQALVYDATLGIWKNGTVSGTDMATVWTNLAAATNEQINASHLTDALSGYNPTNNFKTINGNSIIGTGNITISGGTTNMKYLDNYYTYSSVSGRPTSANILLGNGTTIQFKAASQMTTAKPSTDGNILHFAWDTTAGYETQLFVSANIESNQATKNFLQVRGQNARTWGSWKDVITQRGGTFDKDMYWIDNNYALNMNNSDIIGINSLYTSDLSSNCTEGINWIRSNGNWDTIRFSNGVFYFNDDTSTSNLINKTTANALMVCYYDNWNQGLTGTFHNPAFIVKSSSYQIALLMGGGEVNRGLYLGSQWGLYFDASNTILNYGNIGIGTTSPSYKLHVSGSIYATGGVTALSDARHKTIINPTDLQVEQIARMPAVVYKWNDGREDNGLHVGSIAQDWQMVLPEVVLRANDKEGTLSMQYGVAALVSSIITARKVVDHERRIAELERENKELKLKLKIA